MKRSVRIALGVIFCSLIALLGVIASQTWFEPPKMTSLPSLPVQTQERLPRNPADLNRSEPRPSSPVADSSDRAFSDFEHWLGAYAAASAGKQEQLLSAGVELALQRRSALAALIKSDPAAALAKTVPTRTRATLPSPILDLFEERVSGRGDLEVIANLAAPGHEGVPPVERFAHVQKKRFRAFVYGRRTTQGALQDVPLHGIAIGQLLALHESPVRVLEEGEAELSGLPASNLGGPCPVSGNPSLPGVAVDVGGEVTYLCHSPHVEILRKQLEAREGTAAIPGALSATGTPTRAKGVKTVLFIRANFKDDLLDPISFEGASILMTNVSQFYSRNSYGLISFAATITPLITLPQTKEWYRTNSEAHGPVLADARVAARTAGFNTDQFDLDAVAFQQIFPEFSGNATIGGKGVWLQVPAVGTACHEFGHNLGLFHANAWGAMGDTIIGPGSNVEYGNGFDVMGLSASLGQFNVFEKNFLDWLPESGVETISSNGTYRLYPFDVPVLDPSFKYALKIRKDATRTYWIETRSQPGNNAINGGGLFINWSPWERSNGGTHLLDMTPGSPAQRDDAALALGRTFSDLDAGFFVTSIGVNSTNGAIDVRVNFGINSSNRAPTVLLSAVPSVLPQVPVILTAMATDLDFDPLAFAWDFGDGSPGINSAVVTKSWPGPGEYVVRCVVSDMKGGSASASLVVSVGSPQTLRLSGRVTQAGRALEGVRVAASPSRMAYTDSDGRFTLAGLSAGEYVVTPAKAGYLFSPSFQTVTLTGSGSLSSNFLAFPSTNADNVPLVELTTPLPKQVFRARNPLRMEVRVIDDSPTQTVRFFADGSLLGTVLAAPYDFTWTNPPTGPRVLSATASDDFGLTGSSPGVLVTVVDTPPANDSFFAPIVLSGLTASVTAYNTTATKEPGEPRHAFSVGGRSVWFAWTAPSEAAAVWTLDGQIRNSVIAVYEGSSLETLSEVTSQFQPGRNQVSFAAHPGRIYRIAVDDAYETPGAFTLELATGIAPSVTLTSSVLNNSILSPGSRVDFHASASDPDGSVVSVDFLNGSKLLGSITAPPYDFSLTNLGPGSYRIAARARDNIGATTRSEPISFRIPPPNDDFDQAISLTTLAVKGGTNDGAGAEPGEPNPPGYIGGRSVWYRWTAVSAADAVISVSGDLRNSFITVFQGSTVSNSLVLAAQFESGGTNQLTFRTSAGAEYRISVDDVATAPGAFSIKVQIGQAPNVIISGILPTNVVPAGSSLDLQAIATDPDGTVAQVDFLNKATLLVELTNAPYTLRLTNLAIGSYRIYARARDNIGASSLSAPFEFRVPPANDDFSNRPAFSADGGIFAGTNDGAGAEIAEPAHAGFPAMRSVWYEWTAAANIGGVLSCWGPGGFRSLAVYTGSSLATLTNIASAPGVLAPATNFLSFNAQAGQTYYVAVDDASTAPGEFKLRLATTALPTVNLITIPGSNSVLEPGTPVLLAATAFDQDGSIARVEFYNGSILLGFDETAPFTFLLTNTPVGTYRLFARAVDNLGASADSPPSVLRVPPPNDDFLRRIVLNGLGSSTSGSNAGATKEAGEPIHGYFLNLGRSVWYSWTAPANIGVVLRLSGSIEYSVLAVYRGPTVSALTNVTVSFLEKTGTNKLTFAAEAGVTYQVAVDDAANRPGDFRLDLLTSASPVISLTSVPTNNSILLPGRQIWLSAEASDPDGTVERVTFYNGTNLLAQFTQPPFQFIIPSVEMGTYSLTAVALDNMGVASTSAVVTLRLPPLNDSFSNRFQLQGGTLTTTGPSGGASREPGEPKHAGQLGGASIWWSWTSPSNSDVTVSTDGTGFDTLLGIYVGNTVSNLTRIASDDDSGFDKASRVTFKAAAGTTSQIAVDGYDNASGLARLSIYSAAAGPRIDRFGVQPDGSFQISGIGPGGRTNRVETSTNLVLWTPLLSNTNGSLFFQVQGTNKAPYQFYRVVWP